MKKALTIIAVVAFTASLAMAYGPGQGRWNGQPCYGQGQNAQQAPCYGQGQGYGKGNGYNKGMRGPRGQQPCFGNQQGRGFGKGFNGQNQQAKALTEKEATDKMNDFISKNLKGYKITKTEKFERRMTVYAFELSDKSGNKFRAIVNPWGDVRGPFLAQK